MFAPMLAGAFIALGALVTGEENTQYWGILGIVLAVLRDTLDLGGLDASLAVESAVLGDAAMKRQQRVAARPAHRPSHTEIHIQLCIPYD